MNFIAEIDARADIINKIVEQGMVIVGLLFGIVMVIVIIRLINNMNKATLNIIDANTRALTRLSNVIETGTSTKEDVDNAKDSIVAAIQHEGEQTREHVDRHLTGVLIERKNNEL